MEMKNKKIVGLIEEAVTVYLSEEIERLGKSDAAYMEATEAMRQIRESFEPIGGVFDFDRAGAFSETDCEALLEYLRQSSIRDSRELVFAYMLGCRDHDALQEKFDIMKCSLKEEQTE